MGGRAALDYFDRVPFSFDEKISAADFKLQ